MSTKNAEDDRLTLLNQEPKDGDDHPSARFDTVFGLLSVRRSEMILDVE